MDRGFLLNELACRIETLPSVPNRWMSLVHQPDNDAPASSHGDANKMANLLAVQPSPWSRLLWGPPGSGKTYAIARLVTARMLCQPDSRILLLAPSNLAVDVLLEEVLCQLEAAGLGGLISERKALRYGYARKHSLLTRAEVLAPRGGETLAERVHKCAEEVTSAERNGVPDSRLASMRAELLAAQEELRQSVEQHAQVASIVATTTVQTYLPNNPVGTRGWSLVAVDEATMVAPAVAYYASSIADGAFLIAGDPRQLGPVAEVGPNAHDCEGAWMGTDLFEVCGASSGAGETRRVSENHPGMVRITEQRRCAPGIWSAIEHLYDGVSCRPNRSSSRVAGAPLPQAPVLLMDTSKLGSAPCRPQQRSWCNESSAALSIKLASAIAGASHDTTVAIITPYRAQAARLRDLLRVERELAGHAHRIEVGTVHQFQGSAADVVVFDVVEAEARKHLSRVLSDDTGFRLVNVAVSRARTKLIVVADRRWHENNTSRKDNPLLWDLVVECPASQVVEPLAEEPDSAYSSMTYESAYEAVLGDLLHSHRELEGMTCQHSIRRGDGSLISRADFAIPALKYAVYVDGAIWHLTERRWHNDKRLRGELRAQGWTITVFGAHEVEANSHGCLATVVDQVRACADQPKCQGSADTKWKTVCDHLDPSFGVCTKMPPRSV